MNDEMEQLERELAGFKPAPVSRELKMRIADAIEASGEKRVDVAEKHDVIAKIGPSDFRAWGSQSAGLLAMAAAIAACVVVMVNVATKETIPTSPGPSIAANTTPASVTSVASYRQALAESPEALDRLLDRDATRVLASASSRSDAMNDAWR